jgi:hypothetical protein
MPETTTWHYTACMPFSLPGEGGTPAVTGVATNELTASDDRDWRAGTPWHKHVPARIEAVVATAEAS